MRVFLMIMCMIAINGISLLFVVPYFVSQASTVAVLGGFVFLFCLLPLNYLAVNKISKIYEIDIEGD